MGKIRILIVFIVSCIFCVEAQNYQDSLVVYFRQGNSVYNASYKENGTRMTDFIARIKAVQQKTDHKIISVRFHSNTSPEGTLKINERLGNKRAASVVERLLKDLAFPDSIISIDPKCSRWDDLHNYMHEHHEIKYWEELHEIIKDTSLTDTQKERRVRRLHGGKAWSNLLNKVFPDMRNAVVTVVVGIEKKPQPKPEPKPEPKPQPKPEPKPEPAPIVNQLPQPVVESVDTVQVVEEVSCDKLILKTNTIGWAMLISNVGVEYQHRSGWAFHLPVYFSAMNYFTRTIKFRTFAILPEVRYYIPKWEGFFAGAHFGLGWYNLAFDGDWRYQDHGRNTPAIGGGLNVGYKMPLGKSKRWGLEFSLGAGVYKLHYDKLVNEQNGKLAYDEKRTFFGIDNAAVSFTYTFDLKPKKK